MWVLGLLLLLLPLLGKLLLWWMRLGKWLLLLRYALLLLPRYALLLSLRKLLLLGGKLRLSELLLLLLRSSGVPLLSWKHSRGTCHLSLPLCRWLGLRLTRQARGDLRDLTWCELLCAELLWPLTLTVARLTATSSGKSLLLHVWLNLLLLWLKCGLLIRVLRHI